MPFNFFLKLGKLTFGKQHKLIVRRQRGVILPVPSFPRILSLIFCGAALLRVGRLGVRCFRRFFLGRRIDRFNIEIVLIKQDNKGAQLLGAFVKVCQSGSACLDIGALDRNFRRYAARLLNFALHILFQNTELNFAAEVTRPGRARGVRIERRELLQIPLLAPQRVGEVARRNAP